MNSLAHIEINVSDLAESGKFYSMILSELGWVAKLRTDETIGFYAPDKTHLFLVQTHGTYVTNTFHRKNVGLNHVAFRVASKDRVNDFTNFLMKNNISRLYTDFPKDYSREYEMEEYYAVFFEDPDRIKLEVVFMQ